MIALDTTILVALHRVESIHHPSALAAYRDAGGDGAAWAIPWPCVHEFLGVVTHPRIFSPATPIDIALSAIDSWRARPNIRLLSEDDTYWPILVDLVRAGAIAGPRIHDARIAALCLAHGVRELWTADRDFSRFPKLRTRNPLVSSGSPRLLTVEESAVASSGARDLPVLKRRAGKAKPKVTRAIVDRIRDKVAR